ncbi:MAG: hypothetical protein KDB14_05040 [Planctomycetales bacterium]|nr:hypothetical protein [Planctomycetales bacterium]
MSDFQGVWVIAEAASQHDELALVEATFKAEFEAIGGSALDLLPETKPTSGLSLTITSSNRFTQAVTAEPRVDWFDVQGVLAEQVVPFDGWCSHIEDRLYLIADGRPSWATSKDEAKRSFFRYDDGDTVICDFVELAGGKLLRTVNVLTDGQYISRTLISFERSSAVQRT